MSLSAEQIADRVGPDGFVGASEISAIVGENPYTAAIDIWLRKTGRSPEEPSNPRAQVGLRAERMMAQWYAEDTGTHPALLVPGNTTRHGAVPCVGCTPDFLAFPAFTGSGTQEHPSHAVQLKCVGARMALSWPEDWVPAYVECQVQLEAEVLQVDRVDVAAWLGGTDWRIIPVARDPEFGSLMVAAAVDFWRCVTTDTPPPIDGSESWRKYLAAKYPKQIRETLLEADGAVDEWASEALSVRDEIDAAEARQLVADNNLRELIGDGAGYLGADYVVTWKADKNGKRTLRVKRRSMT